MDGVTNRPSFETDLCETTYLHATPLRGMTWSFAKFAAFAAWDGYNDVLVMKINKWQCLAEMRGSAIVFIVLYALRGI